MSGPWYVKTSWDRVYLMRHDLNPSTAQSECDRLNAEWEQAQVPVEVPQAVVKCKMTVIDEDVKPPGEPTITVDQDGPSCWRVIVNGKYYAPCATEKRIKEIAARVKAERSSAGYGWCDMATKIGVSSSLVDAEWPKLPVKEDIKTVVVNQDENKHWRVVLNGKWEAKCGSSKETAETIEHDTLKGKPCIWTWNCLETGNIIPDLRTVLNLKG